jgi:FolB domain-containing protein
MDSTGSEDAIHIEQLELSARVGVPEEERTTAQRLTVSMTLWPAGDFRDLGDEIASTVNYASVCAEVKSFVSARCDKLVETMADAIASHLLRTFRLRRVDIELRKFVLRDVDHVAVRVSRSDDG